MYKKKLVIYGCEGRGDGDKPYLIRYTMFERVWLQICLHVFIRSDHDDFHDHPWNFLTLVLWRGYIEHTPTGTRRVWPGMILYRPAQHTHWVELPNGKRAVTLVFMGRRVREWGFILNQKWTYWREYFTLKRCW